METVMTGYIELVVILLVLPVFMQIILPLLMLIGYCLVRAVSMLLGGREIGVGLEKEVAV
jgi:hypothetical protein